MDETAQQLVTNICIFAKMVEETRERIAVVPEGEGRHSLERVLESLELHVADLKRRLELLEMAPEQ